jgi:abequosyltransferase
MRNNPVLTIIVPTFNRRVYLAKLLAQLDKEIKGLEDLVHVIIADNHSNDDTALETKKYIIKNPSWRLIRQDTNIGPDRNFLSAIENSTSQYFWIIGDDDLPRNGLIRLIIPYLQNERPSLLYLSSHWATAVESTDFPKLKQIKPILLPPIEYAKKINIFTTFISAWVVNALSLKQLGIGSPKLSEGIGSNFIQLGWILPLIQNSSILAAIDEPVILATAGNTGGYQLINTFAVNYPAFVRKTFPNQRQFQRALIAPFLRDYLPSLIKSAKAGHYSRMSCESNTLPKAIMSLGFFSEFWMYAFPAFLIQSYADGDKSKLYHLAPRRIGRKLKSKAQKLFQSFYKFAIDRISSIVVSTIEECSAVQKKRRTTIEFAKLRKIGDNISLPDDFDLIGHEFLSLGSQFQAARGLRIHCWETETLEGRSSPSLEIGDRVFCNREAYISCANSISVGSDVLIGSNVLITDNYHGSTKNPCMKRLSSPLSCPGEVVVEDGVWIGNNVCILPGSHIGRGSIIGANSVVNSKIPAFSIAVGTPARVIRMLLVDQGKSG